MHERVLSTIILTVLLCTMIGIVPAALVTQNIKYPIHAGDLLITSDMPGHAMKAEPEVISGRQFYPDGTILGKAMGTLESGTGVIEVLLTLQ